MEKVISPFLLFYVSCYDILKEKSSEERGDCLLFASYMTLGQVTEMSRAMACINHSRRESDLSQRLIGKKYNTV